MRRAGTDFEKNLGTGNEEGAGEWWKPGPAYALPGESITDFVGINIVSRDEMSQDIVLSFNTESRRD